VVTNLSVADPHAAAAFYATAFGMEVVMDLGWIVTVADPGNRTTQLSLIGTDRTAPVNPDVSIEVDDVDAVHEEVRRAGMRIVHPLTDEEWGVRRFFYADHGGRVVNVLAHR
jgi:catechol 2,3-dioxygenase-like lactoylglutathione lyase family enzyme